MYTFFRSILRSSAMMGCSLVSFWPSKPTVSFKCIQKPRWSLSASNVFVSATYPSKYRCTPASYHLPQLCARPLERFRGRFLPGVSAQASSKLCRALSLASHASLKSANFFADSHHPGFGPQRGGTPASAASSRILVNNSAVSKMVLGCVGCLGRLATILLTIEYSLSEVSLGSELLLTELSSGFSRQYASVQCDTAAEADLHVYHTMV